MKVEAKLPAAYTRVVVDTNVLISAMLVRNSAPFLLVDMLLDAGCLVFSGATYTELESRLWKPKFDRYLSLEIRRRLLHDLAASACWVDIPAALEKQSWCRDSKDDAFIRTALAAGATRLISGDEDLLVLHPLDDLHIQNTRDALTELVD